jgi:hypothetical protein
MSYLSMAIPTYNILVFIYNNASTDDTDKVIETGRKGIGVVNSYQKNY